MTKEEREEAIKVIKNFPVESMGERKAVLTAIEALEQVPCEDEDIISRDAVYGILMRTYFRDKYSYEEFKDRLEQIPSVNA